MDVHVFELNYASAASTARLITELFAPAQQQQQGQQQSPFPFGFSFNRDGRSDRDRGSSGSDRSRGGQPEGRKQGRVIASADDRTNKLIVTGPTDVLDEIGIIVRSLDSDASAEQSVFVYSLRNADAAQLEGVINGLFNGTGSPQGTLAQPGQPPGLANARRREQRHRQRPVRWPPAAAARQRRRSGRASARRAALAGPGASVDLAGSAAAAAAAAASRPAPARAGMDLAGQVTVVSDADTNSLLVMTSPKNFERVKQIIEELDRPVPQVLIKVLIAEVTHDVQHDVGAEFSVLNIRPNGNGHSGGTDFGVAGGDRRAGRASCSRATSPRRSGCSSSNGKLDVLSRPYILASDNQLASITVGQNVPFPSNSRITDNGQTITNVDYRDVGILLDVIPHINPDGLVIMDVQPTISAPDQQHRADQRAVQRPDHQHPLGDQPRGDRERQDDRDRRSDGGPQDREDQQGADPRRHPLHRGGVPARAEDEDQDRTADLPHAARRVGPTTCRP